MIVALAVIPKDLRARERFTIVAVAVQLVFYAAAYFVTPWDVEWHLRSSWSRLTMQVATPLLYVVMAALAATYHSPHAEVGSDQQRIS